MKIVIGGIRGLPARYGGFETSVGETATRLKQLGHDVSVYCRGKGAGRDCEFEGVKLVYLPAPRSSNLETVFHSIFMALHVIFINRDVEVVHLYNAASSFGGLLLRLSGKPVVMTLDGVEWKREKWNWFARQVWRLATWLSIRVADVAICDSRTVRNFFESKYGKKMSYNPYGAKQVHGDSDSYKKFGLEHRGYFLFVGRLVPEKGVDTLLEAYRLSGSSIPLVIIGGNDKDHNYVSALRSKAVGNVHFLGFRFGPEYESLLAHAKVYVSASKLEGTSPSLLAAMGARVCCLVNGIPENRETGGNSVLYFDGTAEHLSQNLALLAANPEEVEHYAQAGLDRVREHFDWNVVTERYVEAYWAATATPATSVATQRRT